MEDLEKELDNQEEQQVEQPDNGTPQESDEKPEFYLDDEGKLQWNTDEYDDEEEDSEPLPAQDNDEEQSDDSEEDSEDTEEDEPKYTVKVDGEEIEVTQEELLRGYMRQRDYTQKTQQLAEQRRQIEQYKPQQYQQPQYQQPIQQPQNGYNLNAMAKQIAARQLGLESPEDLSELDFDHITAVVEAKQALLNQRDAMMYRQRNIDNLEAQLRNEEPKYDEIMANINTAVQNLPVSKFNQLKQAYSSGNAEPLREFFKEMQKDYYANAIKKAEDKKKPPSVEASANTPVQPTPKQKRIDFKKFGHMSSDQKAQVLIDMGFLD